MHKTKFQILCMGQGLCMTACLTLKLGSTLPRFWARAPGVTAEGEVEREGEMEEREGEAEREGETERLGEEKIMFCVYICVWTAQIYIARTYTSVVITDQGIRDKTWITFQINLIVSAFRSMCFPAVLCVQTSVRDNVSVAWYLRASFPCVFFRACLICMCHLQACDSLGCLLRACLLLACLCVHVFCLHDFCVRRCGQPDIRYSLFFCRHFFTFPFALSMLVVVVYELELELLVQQWLVSLSLSLFAAISLFSFHSLSLTLYPYLFQSPSFSIKHF